MSINFSADTTSGTVPLDVTFTASGTSLFLSQHWNFGNGFISESINPSHEYTCPGVYDVSLTAKYKHLTPGIHVTEAGYVTLTTDNNYLNNLKNGKFGFVAIIIPESGNAGLDILFGAQPGAVDYPELYYNPPNIAFYWSGAGITLDHTSIPNLDAVNDWILVANSTSSWASINGGAVGVADNHDPSLADAHINTIRIGAGADSPLHHPATVAFGFFAVLDLSAVTVNAAFAQNIANAVNGVEASDCYDSEALRLALLGVDSNISGIFWKLDEGGYSGDANSLTVTRYKLADGTIDSTAGGTTSTAGCTGCIISSSNTEINETVTRTNYIRALSSSPKLPENKCCFSPYDVICIGCTSGSGTTFYDSSKTYKICKNVSCESSCVAQYGAHYSVVYDYADECPTCRECYLEDVSQNGREYNLTITNCEVYITDYEADSACSSCLELAERKCFKVKDCNVDDDTVCTVVFEYDDKIFQVSGETGTCGTGVDCADCWGDPVNSINNPFDFLPDTLDSCTATEEAIADTSEETEETVEPDVVWHNKPSAETTLGSSCLTEDVMETPTGESFQHPDIDVIPSGHAVIAYEERATIGSTKIKVTQKATTVENQVVNWRSLGAGQLINENINTDGQKKFRIFDSVDTSMTVGNLAIGFKTGPLKGKMYQVQSVSLKPSTDLIYPVASGSFSYGIDLVFDSSQEKLYATEHSNSQSGGAVSRIIQMDIDGIGGVAKSDALIQTARGIGIDENTNTLYLACAANLYSYDWDSGTATNLVATAAANRGIAVASVLDYIFYTSGGDIKRCELNGANDVTLYSTADSAVYSISWDSEINEIYWIESNNGTIRKSNVDGSDVEIVLQDTIINPVTYFAMGLDIDIGRNHVYWSEYYSGTIKRYDLVTGEIKTIVDISSQSRRMGKIKLQYTENTLSKIYWVSYNEVSHTVLSGGKIQSSVISPYPYYEVLFTEQVGV